MIYRCLSSLDLQARLYCFPVPIPESNKKFTGEDDYDYRQKKTLIRLFEGQFDDVMEFYEMPWMDEDAFGMQLTFYTDYPALETWPDVMTFYRHIVVSETFKQVLDASDEFSHQYTPISIVDSEGQAIRTKQHYYWFQSRLMAKLKHEPEPQKEMYAPAQFDFALFPGEEVFLKTILENRALHEAMSRLALFRHLGGGGVAYMRGARMAMYLSEPVIEAMRAVNVQGLALYSQPFGVSEESLAPVIMR